MIITVRDEKYKKWQLKITRCKTLWFTKYIVLLYGPVIEYEKCFSPYYKFKLIVK